MLPKRSLADLVIAVGHDKPSKGRKPAGDESESDREHEGEEGYEPDEDATIAGEDFAAAVKSGDGAKIAEAFRALMDLC